MYARLAHGMLLRAMALAASDAVSVARAVQAYTYGAGRCYGRMLFSGWWVASITSRGLT